jgi:hypothetical protein
MTEKQKLIEAFKSLDFDALQNLLDDNRSYMDVSKDLFLSTLKQKIDEYEDIKSYENVVEGTCNHCNKGCKAYKFKAKNLPSLPLYFEEKDGKVTDIYLCNALKEDNPDKHDWDIYFSFYEEEKVDFKPSVEHLIILQRVEKAVEEFNNLEKNGLVPIEEVVHWYDKYKLLAKELELDNPFIRIKYKAYEHINSLYSEVSNVVHNFRKNDLAKNALDIYHKIKTENEKSLIQWLLENENNYFFDLKKTDNWEKTGFLILETNPNLLVDCNGYLDGFFLSEIYYNHLEEIMEKYQPTNEHFEQNGGSVECSLKSYLKLYNKYLDLL